MVEARESGEPCKPPIGRLRPRVIFKMGFKQPKNPIRLISLMPPRLDYCIIYRKFAALQVYNIRNFLIWLILASLLLTHAQGLVPIIGRGIVDVNTSPTAVPRRIRREHVGNRQVSCQLPFCLGVDLQMFPNEPGKQ